MVRRRMTVENFPTLLPIAPRCDPDAHHVRKRRIKWVVYKVHLTETRDDGMLEASMPELKPPSIAEPSDAATARW